MSCGANCPDRFVLLFRAIRVCIAGARCGPHERPFPRDRSMTRRPLCSTDGALPHLPLFIAGPVYVSNRLRMSAISLSSVMNSRNALAILYEVNGLKPGGGGTSSRGEKVP